MEHEHMLPQRIYIATTIYNHYYKTIDSYAWPKRPIIIQINLHIYSNSAI